MCFKIQMTRSMQKNTQSKQEQGRYSMKSYRQRAHMHCVPLDPFMKVLNELKSTIFLASSGSEFHSSTASLPEIRSC